MASKNTMAFTASEKEMGKRIIKQHCANWSEIRYDEYHNKPYFVGKRDKDSETEILFPIDSYKSFTFEELKGAIIDSGSSEVNLAIYNSDSTVVMYKAELGLNPPNDLPERDTSLEESMEKVTSLEESMEKGALFEEESLERDTDSSPEESSDSDSMFNKSSPAASVHVEQIDTTTSGSDCLQIDLQSDHSEIVISD